VGYQPWLKEDPESTLIKFNPKDPSSYEKYMDVMNKYFEKVIFKSLLGNFKR
jgi:sodium/potassium-transporting ATPase subunit beta